jgi:hypothetical protein
MSAVLRSCVAAALLVATALPLAAQSPQPSPTEPIFEKRQFVPWATPTPDIPLRILGNAERKPIPREYIIGGAVALVVVALLLLWGASRAWRSSNLFDQQYRFPVRGGPVALRLGGKKSGGHMASISLPPRSEKREPTAVPNETR